MKHHKLDIAVIGLGTFGFELAVQLSRNGHSVMAIDSDEKKVRDIQDEVTVAITADVTDEDVLRKIEINKFDTVVLAMSSNLEAVILAIALMKKMKVPHIIGKANRYIQRDIFLQIGADEVIMPEVATARRLAERISYPNLLEKFEIDKRNYIVEVRIPARMAGKSLRDLDLRRKHNINVLMRKTAEGMQLLRDADYRFSEGDILLVVGDEEQIKRLFD